MNNKAQNKKGAKMLNVTLDEKESIVILEPDGVLSEDDFKTASEIIDPFIEEHGSLNGLIIYSESFPGWDSFSSLITHLKFIKNHHKKVSHIAFVTNSFVGTFSEHITSHFVNAEVKNFAFNELEEAKTWIKTSKTMIKKHGLSIGIERVNEDFFLSFKAIGTLTHEDYEKITPLLDAALDGVKEPHIKALFDVSEFDGWELHAAWDDFKIGLKHGFDFDKIAIYGKNNWMEYAIDIGSWFMSGEVKEFDNIEDALTWLKS